MIRTGAFLLFSFLLWTSCVHHEEHKTLPANHWSDEHLWPVLQAQDQRDIPALITFLGDSSAFVRERAAWAFSSVQDSARMKVLLPLLKDAVPAVRAAAAHALSFSTDTVLLAQLNERAEAEIDPSARTLMMHAAFRAAAVQHRNDVLFLISYLESDDALIRARTASVLARSAKEKLAEHEPSLLHAAAVERDPEVRLFLVGALRHSTAQASMDSLLRWSAPPVDPIVRIAALRALGNGLDDRAVPLFIAATGDAHAGVRRTALEQLQKREGPMDGAVLWQAGQAQGDSSIRIGLWALAMKSGSESGPGRKAKEELNALSKAPASVYVRAALLEGGSYDVDHYSSEEDRIDQILRNDLPAVVRQAEFQKELKAIREVMMRSRYARAEDQYRALGNFLRAVLGSGDAGLVSAAAEELEKEDRAAIAILIDDASVASAMKVLQPIRDLEAILLLQRVVAKRDGGPEPKATSVPFNHPIDPMKLRALKQGQQYRIVTTKGEVIIATDVNDCPGSSLAFDSLVVAGYYNGKAFHRMVPDFVVQGGCPRGDGFGGMPWTVRTEIGRKGFTAGSVGLASAGRDTESCQFFITHVPTPHLDGRYTRFGEVVQGMDIVMELQVGDVMERVERMP